MAIPKEMRIVTLQEALEQYKLTPESVFFYDETETWYSIDGMSFSDNLESISVLFEYTYYVGILYEDKPLYRGDDTFPDNRSTPMYMPTVTNRDFYEAVECDPSWGHIRQLLENGFLYADYKEAARVGKYLNSCLTLR